MKVVIIGGVAGGAAAATRLRRLDEHADIVMFERGPFVSFANCGLPYHIGGTIKERDSLLVVSPEELAANFALDVRVNTEVVAIDREKKLVVARGPDGGEQTESYDKLVLSPGAYALMPPIPGLKENQRIFPLKTIPDMDAIIEFIKEKRAGRALVVGGGFIGLEAAENLKKLGLHVTVVEMLPQVMPPIDHEIAAIAQQQLLLHGLELIVGDGVASFEDTGSTLMTTLSSGKEIEHDLAIFAIGVRPEVALATEAGLEMGTTRAIKVNGRMQTSDPDIYAVGDAVEVEHFVTGKPAWIALAGPAAKQGRLVADNITGMERSYKRTQGTAVVKLFDLCVGSTGLNERQLKEAGIPYKTVITHLFSHAGYYPGSKVVTIKLLFSPEDGRVLGAQTAGEDGADKRIDVIATAMRGKMTVWDLANLELAYAPPFGSAKDPVNMAGFVACNVLEGKVSPISVDELDEKRDDYHLIDVRGEMEFSLGCIPGAVNIPLPTLRSRLNEIPNDRKIAVNCGVGRTSYIACRVLLQNGFREVYNLSGGWTTWSHVHKWSETQPLDSAACVDPALAGGGGEGGIVADLKADVSVCATGIQCPGPILKTSKALQGMEDEQVLEIEVSDPGFISDIKAWCEKTGNRLLSLQKDDTITAFIQKGGCAIEDGKEGDFTMRNDKTMVVFSGDLDKVIASFIIANGAASMDRKVTMFFTFWGLNVLRKESGPTPTKPFMDKMFSSMMPKGPGKLKLSKMNMLGMGTAMMKKHMKAKNVDSLEDLIQSAREQGVRLVACRMTMDIMGIREEELIDDIEIGGVATFLASSEESDATLFI